MQVFQIIAEQNELAEIDVPVFGKKAKLNRQVKKTQKGAVKDEQRQMEVELLNYLKTSKQKATADNILKYFDQKGMGQIAEPIVNQFQSKGMKKAAKVQGKADAAAQKKAAADQAAGMGPDTTVDKNFDKSQKLSAFGKVGDKAESMYSEATGEDILTKREVKNIISQVVAKGFGGKAGFDKSRFAQDKAPTFKSSQAKADPETQAAIDKLQAAGYKISK